ncbi:EAL domain-containing protein [Alicycliphilus denitrificans]|uniref:bifunctional diguanylate cyclase/phosphodiesterase n=1 Tax=Alicycliphilus denitrificans TaxID=179636 RepID=UPI00384FB7C9
MPPTPYFTELRQSGFWLASLLAGLLLLWALPPPDVSRDLASYLPLHTTMEVLSISIAAMVFGLAWATQKYRPNGRTLILGLGLLGVALLDMGHSLSFPGMPDFITPSGTEKGIHFWLAARSLAAVTLLCAALWPQRQRGPADQADRLLWLLVVLLIVGGAHYVFLLHPDWMPRTFIAGEGLTHFKIHFEYGLIAAYLLAALLFGLQLPRSHGHGLGQLALAACTMAMSEFFFTLYANANDVYNIAGHVYKILAYGFLCRGLFTATVHSPFQDLWAAEARQRATLATLPDLLLEVDRQGVCLAVHASEPAKLAAPIDQILGKKIDDILPPEVAATCFMALAEAERNGITRGQRYGLTLPTGLHHFELAIAKKPGATPPEDSYLTLVRDITATVHNEERLALQSRQHAALLDLQQYDNDEPEADFLRRALLHAQQLTGSDVATIHFVPNDQSRCELAASTAAPADQPDLANHCLQALRERHPVVLNLGTAPIQAAERAPASLARLISLPLLEGDKVCMLLCVGNKAQDYDVQDVQTLQMLADSIWRRIHQRRQDALIHRLSEALDQSPHQVVICDTQAHVVYVNRAFSQVSGYGAQEILGLNPKMLQSGLTPRSTYEDMWRKLPQGLPWQGELINRRKSGQIYTESAFLYPIRDAAGQITHYVAHKEDITQRREAEERIRALSNFDTLTGLLNKKAFDEQLALAIERAGSSRHRLSVMWLNLDGFKLINESLGHAAGDELLVEVANRLRISLSPHSTLARYSGDAFVAIVPKADQASVALMVQEALLQLQASTTVQGHPVSISASAGIAVYPNDARTASTLTAAAEVAMYRVKQDGRNGLRFFAPEMQAHTQRSLELATGLKDAAHNAELFLVYQPQRSLGHGAPDSGPLRGAEALLRWRHPKWGLVSPAEFIPIAEQSGAISAIDFWVVEQAARQIRAWDAAGLPPLVIAVNLSATQFGRPQLVEELLHIVRRVDVPPQRIEVELTEAVALKYPELAETTIAQLHEAGFKVALDDFGTGYSSMSYLKRYAIDKLKIDQSFVKDLSAQHSDLAIVTAIIKMAHSLGISTIAEGVETAEQATQLQACGCDEIQGYWYSRPLEPAAFEAFVKGHAPDQTTACV